MSLKCYDEAIMEKVKKVFPNVTWADEDGALNRNAEKDNKLVATLPLITLYRTNNTFNFEQFGNDSHTRRGRYVLPSEERIKAFPVNIFYQMDIYSDKRVEVDDIWREIIQFFYTDPEIDVHFEGLEIPYKYVVWLVDTDNTTDVSSFSDKGRIHRQTINLEVRQAQMLFTKYVKAAREIPLRMVEIDVEDHEHI